MGRTHAQQFANQVLPRVVFANPLAFLQSIAATDPPQALGSYWEKAGADLAPIERTTGAGFAAMIERRGRYVILIVTPPAPRDSGDPVSIAIIGRGDGVSKITTLAYYVLELERDAATQTLRFHIVSRTGAADERGVKCGEGPLPDPRWFADHAYELYTGRQPFVRTHGVASLPTWYWWLAFDGASALRVFNEAKVETERFDAVRRAPVLLMPEIADGGEIYNGAQSVARLRELRGYLRRDTSLAPTWQALVEKLSNTTIGNPGANMHRALPLIAEAGKHGAFNAVQAYELAAATRSKLAAIGIDRNENYAQSEQLYAAAREAERSPRLARGSAAPPINAEDPVWRPVFLDETDLPEHVRAESDETFSTADQTFQAYGGLRAGFAAWAGPEYLALSRVIDSRWVFRTSAAAVYFMRAVAYVMSDGLPQLPIPEIGDDTLAYGDDGLTGHRRTQIVIVRVGRVVARIQAYEGAYAAQAREILHAATLQPLVARIARRLRQGIAAYWLAVAYPTNAVAALVHSPGYDAARLLAKYPLLAHSELPSAIALMGDQYAPVARGLASFQAQVRAHRWATYREAMLSLTRLLLATDMGDPRVNAAYALEIVSELRRIDPDPVWLELDAWCRAR